MATTASILLAYRKELKDGGTPAELVDDLVRDAARALVESEGLVVQELRLEPNQE